MTGVGCSHWRTRGGAVASSDGHQVLQPIRRSCFALMQVGLKWSDMRLVDNSCKPHPNVNVQDRILGELQDIDPEETNPDPSPFEPLMNSKI